MRLSDRPRWAKHLAWVVPLFGVGGASLAFVGCGPSFQAIYEGDAQFEHCYALDDTPSAPMQEKGACWRDWSQRFTYGQTRDRVEYAAVRSRALTRVNGAPTDEALMQAAPGEGSEFRGILAPAPTSAFASPPKTLAPIADAGARASTSSHANTDAPGLGGTSSPVAEPPPPGSECSGECTRVWRGCSGACTGAGCDKCQKAFKTCMKVCFKTEAAPPARAVSRVLARR